MNLTVEERFWRHVARTGPDECWPWSASTDGNGYGRFWLHPGELGVDRERLVMAHRIAFRLVHGCWPQPCALHGCDNPPCCNAVNPDLHIHEGTRSQNAGEMFTRGMGERIRAATRERMGGERNYSAKLTWEAVAEIRRRHAAGERQADLARAYGMTSGPINAIIRGRTWRVRP